MKDASLVKTRALPAAAGTVHSEGMELPTVSSRGVGDTPSDFVCECPELNTTQLPDSKTATYTLQHDTDSAFGTAETLATVAVQIGTGGAGAAAVTRRIGIPSDHKPHVRLAVTTSAGAGDCSAATATLWVHAKHDVLV